MNFGVMWSNLFGFVIIIYENLGHCLIDQEVKCINYAISTVLRFERNFIKEQKKKGKAMDCAHYSAICLAGFCFLLF